VVICIISLALCLHVNTHNAEAEHTVYEFESVHFHDVHQKQNHIHHDNFHEHFGESVWSIDDFVIYFRLYFDPR
jgi:hypothetical protein